VSIEKAPPGRKCRWVDTWQPCWGRGTRCYEMLLGGDVWLTFFVDTWFSLFKICWTTFRTL